MAGLIGALGLFFIFLIFRGSGSGTAATTSTSTDQTNAAIIGASAQLQAQQIAAGVAATQSNNQLTLGSESIAGAVSIAGIQANEAEQLAQLQAGIQTAGISAQSTIAQDSINASVTMANDQLATIQQLSSNQTATTLGLAEINAVGNYNIDFANNATLLNALAIVKSDPGSISIGQPVALPLPTIPTVTGAASTNVAGGSGTSTAFAAESALHSAVATLQANPTDPNALSAVRSAYTTASATPGVDKTALSTIGNALAAFG